MASEKHECIDCGMKFKRLTDKLIHWSSQHDRGYLERHERRLRNVSCWRCATEMPVGEDGQFRCECGFVLPPKAQFVEPSEEVHEQQQ